MTVVIIAKVIWHLLPWDWKIDMALYAAGHLLRWLFRSEREEALALAVA